jgi:hypothetical protein
VLARDARANPCAGVSCDNVVTVIPGFAEYMSLALDSTDRPVIAYEGGGNELRLLHCGNVDCTSDNQMHILDTGASYTSLELDAAGNPVIAYYYDPTDDLRIVHCNDPSCVGNDESIVTADSDGNVGTHASLILDAAGHPVVSYYDSDSDDLKVLHCGTASCDSGNVINRPDSAGFVGTASSIDLDLSGNPVVAYVDQTNFDLKVLHCDDPDCAPGGDSVVSPDTEGDVGPYLSLEVDAAGNPVVSYRDFTNFDLRLLHCGNPDCTSGNTITAPDTAGFVGSFTSLVLDSEGSPVISHWDAAHARLKFVHCGNPNCSEGNWFASPDDDLNSTAPIGQYTSIALDTAGRPVIAYTRHTGGGLGIVRCVDANCDAADTDGDGCQDAQEQMTAGGTEAGGGRRDPKNPWDYFNPTRDGRNRVDDILAVLAQYFVDSPGAGYTAGTDRSFVGPDAWDLGPPDGLQRADDVIGARSQFMHDCF